MTNIRLLRVKKGLTMRQAARELGMSEALLCRIERGQAYVPPCWRERLARALGCKPEEILDPEPDGRCYSTSRYKKNTRTAFRGYRG